MPRLPHVNHIKGAVALIVIVTYVGSVTGLSVTFTSYEQCTPQLDLTKFVGKPFPLEMAETFSMEIGTLLLKFTFTSKT